MKTNIKSSFYIMLALLFLSAGEAKADEWIRYSSNDSTSFGTIIRHYTGNLDVACYNNAYKPYFALYKIGVTITNEWHLYPMDTICDFEIYEDTVYFCGRGNINKTGSAVLGYFAVADLIAGNPLNVYYLALPAMDLVKAIDVGWFASRKHVVGVGEAINYEGMMVDLIDESSYWKVNHAHVGGDSILLSDVAITLNKVVVTSTKKRLGFIFPGRLWIFDNPTWAGSSLFPHNVNYWDHNNVGQKYLVKKLFGDNFVTAYRKKNVGPTNAFIVSYFNGSPQSVTNVSISESPLATISMGDMDVTMGSYIVNLLLYGVYQTNSGPIEKSVIYEVRNCSQPDTVRAHVYDGVFFTSLDHVWIDNLDDQHFVMLGRLPYGYGRPYYARYHSTCFDGSCFEKKQNVAKAVDIDFNQRSKYIDNAVTLQIPVMIPASEKYFKINTECFSHTQSPVYEDEQ